MVKRLKLSDHVQFVDKFVGRVELGRWLEAADVLVSPAPASDRIGSGTLPYAMAAGRPTVATASPYAAEMLADGRGVVVPDGDPAALAAAIVDLLGDPDRREVMARAAYAHGRNMTWSQVGGVYADRFADAAASWFQVADTRVAVRSA